VLAGPSNGDCYGDAIFDEELHLVTRQDGVRHEAGLFRAAIETFLRVQATKAELAS
jgi:hypothetical protein